jgi:hypothetical protein
MYSLKELRHTESYRHILVVITYYRSVTKCVGFTVGGTVPPSVSVHVLHMKDLHLDHKTSNLICCPLIVTQQSMVQSL